MVLPLPRNHLVAKGYASACPLHRQSTSELKSDTFLSGLNATGVLIREPNIELNKAHLCQISDLLRDCSLDSWHLWTAMMFLLGHLTGIHFLVPNAPMRCTVLRLIFQVVVEC